MLPLVRLFVGLLGRLLYSRRNLLLENLMLRQQLAAFKRRNERPKLAVFDRLFWVLARKLSTSWKSSLLIVNPETVTRWHRSGFRLYWRWLSRRKDTGGRKQISQELRELIFQMVAENPTWGAPRIHGELLNSNS